MAGGRGAGATGGAGGAGYAGQRGEDGTRSTKTTSDGRTFTIGGGGGGGGTGYATAGAGGNGNGSGQSGGAGGTAADKDGRNGANYQSGGIGAGGGGGGFDGGTTGTATRGYFFYYGGNGGNGGNGSTRYSGAARNLTAGGGGGGGAGGAGFYTDTIAATTFAISARGGKGGNGGNALTRGVVGRGGGGDGGAGLQDGAAGASITLANGGYVVKGGAGGSGSGGSYGGAGIRLNSAGLGARLTNYGFVYGGYGGFNYEGAGGTGGAGVVFAGAGGTLVNIRAIGGGGGGGGRGGTGAGGAGVIGAGLTVANSGSITGGTGAVQADAITLTGGQNTLALGANASISGAVDIQNHGTLTFDQSVLAGAPANVVLSAPIIGLGGIIKVGTGTLTLSGTNTYIDGTTIAAGTLSVSADANLGGADGRLTLAGGTLETTASLSSARRIILSADSTVQVDGGSGTMPLTTTLTGTINGTAIDGSVLTKTGTGTLVLTGDSRYGSTTIAAGTLDLGAATSAGDGAITFGTLSGTATATLALETGAQPRGSFRNSLVGFNASSVLDLKGFTVSSTSYANGTLTLVGALGGMARTERYSFTNPTSTDFVTSSDGNGGTDVALCFVAGTRIRTIAGDVRIEALRIGELVVTAHGRPKPVRWVGRRSYSSAQARGKQMVLPVCIKAGALADGVPQRDLWVSPGHAMLVEDQLVHAYLLVNGLSIAQAETVDVVAYFNIELDEHDVIFAEGAPAETFYDNGMRCEFANAAEFANLYPDRLPGVPVQPLLEDGFVLEAIRRRIDARAGLVASPNVPGELLGFIDVMGPDRLCGWAQDRSNPEEPVRLDVLVDGRRVARVLANKHRADLQKAGVGRGRHAFEVPIESDWHGVIIVQRSVDQRALPLSDYAKAASDRAA